MALQLDPASIAGNVFSALYWDRQGDHQAALKYLQAAAAVDPENPSLQIEIGATLAEMGDLPTAQTFYELATQLAPNTPSTWRALAEFALSHQIQIRQIALPAARRAVILAPDDPPALDIMGLTLLALGDYHSAETYLYQAITLQPDYAPAQLHLGIVYQNLGDLARAREQFNLVRQLAPHTWTADQAQRWLEATFP
jgi:tetratricopeptide (TPR) repeat protein